MAGHQGGIHKFEADELEAELQALVDAGLLTEARRADGLVRYAPRRGGDSAADAGKTTFWPAPELVVDASDGGRPQSEPCHYCGADLGYDGGGRCLGCYVALPPEMA